MANQQFSIGSGPSVIRTFVGQPQRVRLYDQVTPASLARVRRIIQRGLVDLATPVRSERVRGFQPPWYTVFVYRCAAGHEVRVRAGAFIGQTAVPAIGAIRCPQC